MRSLDLEDAEDMIEGFFGAYPELPEWQQQQARETKQAGYVETLAGRPWRWAWDAKAPEDLDPDDQWFDQKLTGFHRNFALNHPIQGTAAEVMLRAMTLAEKALRDTDARLCMTVHDELSVTMPDDPETKRRAVFRVLRAMVTAWREIMPAGTTWRAVVDWGWLPAPTRRSDRPQRTAVQSPIETFDLKSRNGHSRSN